MDRIVSAKAVPWQPGLIGIEIEYESGRVTAYPVSTASIEEVQQEIDRMMGSEELQRLAQIGSVKP